MEKRLTLTGVTVLLAIVGLLPVLAMIIKSFFVQGSFGLNAYEALLASGGQPHESPHFGRDSYWPHLIDNF